MFHSVEFILRDVATTAPVSTFVEAYVRLVTQNMTTWTLSPVPPFAGVGCRVRTTMPANESLTRVVWLVVFLNDLGHLVGWVRLRWNHLHFYVGAVFDFLGTASTVMA